MHVHVSARRVAFPHHCACCGAPPNTQYIASHTRVTGTRVVRTHSASWQVPYCAGCIAHVQAWPGSWGCGTWCIILMTCFLWLPVQLFLDASSKKRAYSLCGSSCAVPWAAATYLGWNGSVESFDFASTQFAFEFMLSNRRNLINLPYEVQAELQRYVDAKTNQPVIVRSSVAVAPPPPSSPVQYALPIGPASSTRGSEPLFSLPAAAPVNPDEAFVTGVLERLENLKGAAARKNALEHAIANAPSQGARERVLIEAARIEVRAVLDKVDTLKTPAAKRRHLEAALEQIRNDPVPDHLQAQEIAALESALRNLGP
jgi:hypothetical protein